MSLPRLFIGGGMSYFGPTSTRDKLVVEKTAQLLFNELGNSVEIVTGGTPGIPQDFALAWHKAGGKHVLCVVSSEYEEEYKARQLPFEHVVIGETQEKRRLAVTKLERIHCALFVQGGKFSTHEMQLFEQNKVPVVPFVGSGRASGGEQPYEGYSFKTNLVNPMLHSIDPDENVDELAVGLCAMVRESFDGTKSFGTQTLQ